MALLKLRLESVVRLPLSADRARSDYMRLSVMDDLEYEVAASYLICQHELPYIDSEQVTPVSCNHQILP